MRLSAQTHLLRCALFRLCCLGLFLTPGVGLAQECVEDVLCVIADEQQDAVRFYVDNLADDDFAVVFEVEAENLTSEVSFPYAATFPGRQRTYAFALRRDQPKVGWSYSYRFSWRKAVVNRQNCVEGVFCVITEERGDVVQVSVDNRQPAEVTVSLDLKLNNAATDAAFPLVRTYPGNRQTTALTLRRLDATATMEYGYSYRWAFGSLYARHDDAFAYALPYGAGKSFTVIQGFGGAFTHQGVNAIDWNLPERTPVHAARAGVVVEVVANYDGGGLDDRYKTRANRIVIRHNDGTMGNYVHLARNGAFVAVGQFVEQGQAIGVSGNTGYSSGPHLHFEVYKLNDDLRRETLPIQFRLDKGRAGRLEEGKSYTASGV